MEGYIKFYAQVEPEQAQIQSLVTKIRSDLLPIGANLISIYDTPQPQIITGGVPIFRGFSVPEPQNHTAITNSYTSIAF